MPQNTRTYNGYEYTQQPDGSWVRGRPVDGGQVIADPAAQYEVPQAQGDAARSQAEAAAAAAEAPYAGRIAAAEAEKAEVDAGQAATEQAVGQRARATQEIMRVFQNDTILSAIRNARAIAREGGTGYDSVFASLPATRARALETELSPIVGNLAFDRLQQMREASTTGAALGSVSENELSLLGSTVANLDTGVDRATFLRRLDQIERHFIGAQLAQAGIHPRGEEGRQAMREQYGYTGVFDDETPGQRGDLAGSEDTEARMDIPEEYQREHLRYLRDNWGNMDPGGYARFRAGLDQEYGLQPDLRGYSEAVTNFNALAAAGGTPDSLGGVPAPTRERGAMERFLNAAVETGPGTMLANMGNAGAMGIPAVLAGNQDELAMQREVRPGWSMAGEVAGGITGSMATGGAMSAIPAAGRYARALNNPVVTDAVHGSVYGATQDTEDPLRGALWGGGSSIVGGVIGQRVGEAMPSVFAPNAVRQADEAVPTSQDLRGIASQQYGDVQRTGVNALPDQTQDFANTMNRTLAQRGRVGPQSDSYIGIDGTKLRAARDLINEFSGQNMTPRQAQTVRRSLSEATVTPDAAENAIAASILRDFDNWSAGTLPGIDVPNSTASRYLQGDQIGTAIERGIARGERNLTGTPASGLRTQFGQLDDAILRGDMNFAPEVSSQIAKTARGDMLTNSLRRIGEIGRTNPFTAVGAPSVAGLAGYAAGLGPIPSAVLGLGTAGAGALARRGADRAVTRSAMEAQLLALGGDAYREALDQARTASGRRAGQVMGGLFGSSASIGSR